MEQERYELPDGWEWFPLLDKSHIGVNTETFKAFKKDTLVPFISMSDIDQYTGLNSTYQLRDISEVKQGYVKFQKNSILVAKITPCAENNKTALITNCDFGYATTEVYPINPCEELNPKYFLHYFRSPSIRNILIHQMEGATGRKRIPIKAIKNLYIPLPPLPEQRRIADKLDAVLGRINDAIRLSQDNLASLDDLFASLLQQAFDPLGKASEETRYELPDGWEWKKLSDILVLHYGKALKTSDRVSGNIKVYGSNGVIDTHNNFLCSYPTVIIGRKGSVGETNLCTDSCWVIDTAFFTEIKDKAKLCLKYFFYFTKTNNTHRLTQNGVKPGINRNDYLNQSIPLPPLPEQHRIADKLDALSGKIAMQKRAIEEKLDKLNHLKNSVLDAAFRGRL